MDWMDLIVKVFGIIFVSIIFVSIAIRIIRDYAGKKKSVYAELIYKHSSNYYRQTKTGEVESTNNVLVFDMDGKRRDFLVSTCVYDTFEKGERGILKYKGSRFIDFEQS